MKEKISRQKSKKKREEKKEQWDVTLTEKEEV